MGPEESRTTDNEHTAGSNDDYVTLGADKNTSPTDIKRAYHCQVRGCHPDRMVNASPAQRLKAEECTKVLNNVYEILSDATLPAEYDQYLRDRPNTQASNTQSNQEHTEMELTKEFEPVLVPRIFDFLYVCAKFVYSS
jgi:DnaJ-class molecular chaperone